MKPFHIMIKRRPKIGTPGSLSGVASMAFALSAILGSGGSVGALRGSTQMSFATAAAISGGAGYPGDLPAATVTLNTAYGYTAYVNNSAPANTVINATTSTWIINNSKNSNPTPGNTCASGSLTIRYIPVDIQSAGAGLWFYNGRINGIVPQDSDWDSTYCGSATSFRFQNCPGPGIANGGPTISDVRIDRTWDAIRFIYSNNWTVQRIYASYVRDDAIENDVQEGGIVRDSLFDGCLNFMACDPSSNPPEMPTQQHILLDGVLVRLRLSWQQGELTHGSFFKYATDSYAANNPRLTIKNCVFAIEDVNHNGFSRQNAGWAKLEATGHSNNYLLNLTDNALPGNYPLPPGNANFTILNGQAARDYWASAKAAWLAAHSHLTT